jgi:hypothetical protein
MARLERAALTGEPLRLVFPGSAVMLVAVTVEYPKAGWAQLEGRVVGPPLVQDDATQSSAERAAEDARRQADGQQ